MENTGMVDLQAYQPVPFTTTMNHVLKTTTALEPFIHQVTGRSHMLSLNSTTLCKSLLPRELLFYTSLPEELKIFTPELRGVQYAQLEEDDQYKFTATELFVKSNPAVNNHTSGCDPVPEDDVLLKTTKHPQVSTGYEKILYKGLERFKYHMTNGFKSHPWTIDKDAEAITESIGANPWGVRQHRREINRMLSRSNSLTDEHEVAMGEENGIKPIRRKSGKLLRGYILLEDLTARFKHPNVIDFKMGRQIERDDCSQEKKDKHVQLAKNSSTGTLMLRIAGMQVYQVDSGHYLCRDKYYGRGLSSLGFKGTLFQFLHNGKRTMIEVIDPIVKSLDSLMQTLEKQDTFRFYASSLLILYEGEDIQSSNDILGNQKICSLGGNSTGESDKNTSERRVDVRMIDFAHSTYKGFSGDKSCHHGPDQDCLRALANLIAILKDIKKEVMNSEAPRMNSNVGSNRRNSSSE